MSIRFPTDEYAGTPGEFRQREATEAKVQGLRAKGYTELRLDELETVKGGLWFIAPDGGVWVRAEGELPDGRTAGRDAFALAGDGRPLWFRLAASEGGPATRAELEGREERKRQAYERQKTESAGKLAKLLKDPPARVVTLGDESRALGGATLRQLGERLAAAGAVIVIEKGGGVTVRAASGGNEHIARLARAVVEAREAIVAAVGGTGPVDPKSLPDQQVAIGGHLLGSKDVGRQ